MTRRFISVLFAVACLAMVAALFRLLHEMSVSPEVPSVSAAKSKSPSAMPQRPIRLAGAAVQEAPVSTDTAGASIEEELAVEDAIRGEALLTFSSEEALAAFAARAGAQGLLTVVSIDPALRMARIRYEDLAALKRELAEHGSEITHAGPNLIARIPGLPAETQKDTANAGGVAPFRSQGLDLIGAPANRSEWGKGVTVAVLDSGVSDHPSLKNVTVAHLDLVNDGEEFNGHGTAMASLIAGADAQVGGVSPASSILDVRVADPGGISNTSLLASGIMRAVESGAQVINISLGSTQNSAVLEQAVRYAISRGVVVVAAAGNDGMNGLSYPAGIPGVVSVGAVDASGKQAWFSNSGSGLSLVAPGVGIVSAYANGQLVIGSGTSQAAAIASGTAAYLLGRGYQGVNVPTVMIRSARPTGAPQTAVGAGILHIP